MNQEINALPSPDQVAAELLLAMQPTDAAETVDSMRAHLWRQAPRVGVKLELVAAQLLEMAPADAYLLAVRQRLVAR